jgi:hypothetical protein
MNPRNKLREFGFECNWGRNYYITRRILVSVFLNIFLYIVNRDYGRGDPLR